MLRSSTELAADARTIESVKRSLAKLGDAPFVGIAEAAEIIGVPKPNVRRDFINRGRMPQPVQELRATPLWLRMEVEEVARRYPRAA